MQDLILGVSNETFARAALTLASTLGGLAVKHLGCIARDIGALKATVAIIARDSETSKKDISDLKGTQGEIVRDVAVVKDQAVSNRQRIEKLEAAQYKVGA